MIERILDAYPGGHKDGAGIRIPCPAHKGTGANLHLWPDGERIGASCYSQDCAYADIAAAIKRDTGVDLQPGPSSPRQMADIFLDAEYYTAEGKRTASYRKDWPRDWNGEPCDWSGCKQATVHKHFWRSKGTPSRGLLLKLWEPGQPLDVALVVITEGEKDARAVRDAGYIAASYCGGSKAAAFADYSPVAERPVVVWPDADAPGRKAAKTAGQKALDAGAFMVHAVPTGNVTNGAGAADYSAETIRGMIINAEQAEEVTALDAALGITGAPGRGHENIESDSNGLATILAYLKLEIRRNDRCLRAEVRRTDWPAKAAKAWTRAMGLEPQPDGWITFSDEVEAGVNNKSRQYYYFQDITNRPKAAAWGDRDFRQALMVNYTGHFEDPFKNWLEALPAWDGESRIARLWIETVGMADTELNRAAGSRFLVGAVRRAIEPGCIHDWMPVLVGPQGLGKSSLLRGLVGMCEEWFSDGAQIDGTPKERMETTGPAVISEFAEMGGLDRAGAAGFKNYIVQRADQLRPAYGRNSVRVPRRWVGAGTANDESDGVLPMDGTGARRYVVMTTTWEGNLNELREYAAEGRAWVGENLSQLWAEALAVYRKAKQKGEDDMNLIPGELRQAQESAAEGMSRHNESMTALAAGLWEFGHNTGYGQTLAALMVEAGLASTEADAAKDRRTQIAFGAELRGQGWTKRQTLAHGVIAIRWTPPVKRRGPVCADCGQMDDLGHGRCHACVETRMAAMSATKSAFLPYSDDTCPVCGIVQLRLEDIAADKDRWLNEQLRQNSAWKALVKLRLGEEYERADVDALLPYADHQDAAHLAYAVRQQERVTLQAALENEPNNVPEDVKADFARRLAALERMEE